MRTPQKSRRSQREKMKVITDEKLYVGAGAVLALGMFDGVHLGHRALIRRAVALARERKLDAMVCTFDRHPMCVIRPGFAPEMLMTVEERLKAFQELGADWALVKPFTRELADVEAEVYLRGLVAATKARAVVAGENYSFGRAGRGDARLIRALEEELGFEPVIMKSVREGGDVVSSTLIRRLLSEGEDERAARLLGRAAEVPNSK
jgi:riboflavin kinase/FMN adenylyltransferase